MEYPHLVRAVVLVVRLALRALEARPNLSAYTHSVSLLDKLALIADFDGLADDFVPNAEL